MTGLLKVPCTLLRRTILKICSFSKSHETYRMCGMKEPMFLAYFGVFVFMNCLSANSAKILLPLSTDLFSLLTLIMA